jgi:hypothetical protein
MIEANINCYERGKKVRKPQKGDMGTFTVIWKVQRVDRRTSKQTHGYSIRLSEKGLQEMIIVADRQGIRSVLTEIWLQGN